MNKNLYFIDSIFHEVTTKKSLVKEIEELASKEIQLFIEDMSVKNQLTQMTTSSLGEERQRGYRNKLESRP